MGSRITHVLLICTCSLGLLPCSESDQHSLVERPVVGIVGGGIAGAACALALQQRGISYILLERDACFAQRRAGYGVTLQQGVSALKELGLLETALSHDVPSSSHYIFDPKGNIVGFFGRSFSSSSEAGGKGANTKTKYNVHIPRQLLREIMMQKVDPERVRWGSRVKGIQRCEQDTGMRITLEGGEQILADLVIGADGVRSRIRQEVAGAAPPSFLGVMVIMGMASIDHPLVASRVFQTNDGDNRLFCMPFQDGGVTFWQLSFNAEESLSKTLSTPQALRQEALRRCSGWHDPVEDLIASTSDENVSGHPVYDAMPIPAREVCCHAGEEGDAGCGAWNRAGSCSRIVLVGDAAHPMAPFKAQGANQALLDAVGLAKSIGDTVSCCKDDDWAKSHKLCESLRGFEGRMFQRSSTKVQASRTALSMLHSPMACDPGTWDAGRGVGLGVIEELRRRGVGTGNAGQDLDAIVNSVLSGLRSADHTMAHMTPSSLHAEGL